VDSTEKNLEACQSLVQCFQISLGHETLLYSTNFCETPIKLLVVYEAKKLSTTELS